MSGWRQCTLQWGGLISHLSAVFVSEHISRSCQQSIRRWLWISEQVGVLQASVQCSASITLLSTRCIRNVCASLSACVCVWGRDKCICFGDCFCLKTPEPYNQTTLHWGLCCYRKVCFRVFAHAIVCVYMFAGNSAFVPEVRGATVVLLATFYRAVPQGCGQKQ